MKMMNIFALLLLGCLPLFGQTPTYEYRIMNDNQVSPTVYEFDIYLKRTGSDALEVANTQVGISFNGLIRNGGVLTFAIVSGTSEFAAGQIPTSFSVDTLNKILRIAPKANPGAGSGTVISSAGSGTRFGRFRITNSTAFASLTPNLAWNFISTDGKYPSRLSAYVGTSPTDITVPASHLTELVNPTLNASISGTKFNDLNGDGVHDPGEPGLPGWVIRISVGGNQVDTAITDASGNYGFPNLANGTYVVTEKMQAGWIQTTSPASYSVTVTSGSFSTNNNFGNYHLASIDGLKFNDANGDGVKQPEEAGVSNWRIRLSKNGVPFDSALTDGSGNYSFDSLTAGSYTVSELVGSGWLQTYPGSPGTYTVAITSGTTSTGRNFGNFQYGSISGQKFKDSDGDGVKDPGEVGLSGWQISLSGPVAGSTTTDVNGNYSFSALTAGTYTVSEVLQGGWVQSYPSTPGTHVLAVSSGSAYANKDFGNYQPGSISGTKYNDLNGNGVRDVGESGLSNWRIRLAQSGVPKDSALTDGSGNFSFVNLVPGSYTVSESLKSGWTQTAPAPPGTYAVVVSSGSAVTGRDFGNFQFASISGTKFEDANGNGARDAGEPTLSGWEIRLFKDAVLVASTTTDVSGNFVFNNVSSGTYAVGEVLQSGWKQTYPPSAGLHTVSVTSGSATTGKDFGNFHYGSISGTKFNDLNGNAVKDPGEAGLAGWQISLSGPVAGSTVTDANGNYSFSNLTAGSYTVSETGQSGWLQTYPVSGFHTVSISSGSNASGRDFGNFQLGSVSGVAFNDLDGNGAKDFGEPALSSWNIKLFRSGIPADSALTDGAGHYSFSNLTAGTYTVSEQVQNGWTVTRPASPGTYTIPVTSGTSALNTDFGNFQYASISGTLFNDLNASGVKDLSEPGLAGWRIRLSRNGVPTDSMLTDVNGGYAFGNLTVGTYAVSEVLQPTWFQSAPALPGTFTISVTTGGTAFSGTNFGNYQRGSISGTAFDDVNGNGAKDGGEPVLSGWRIRLAGVRIDSALTDGSGNYSFINLVPGNYGVYEDVQSGWTQTLPPSQGQYLVALSSGAIEVDKNFGNFRTTGIAGVAFNDLNANGVKDVGEPGVSAWKIRLSRDGAQVDSVLTDSAGAYLYKDLIAGTYTVSQAQQPGWNQSLPAAPGTYTVVITSGSSASARDFGNYQKGALRGVAFLDVNGNGTKDSADTPISGLRIRLSGAKTDSMLTDGAGAYAFTNLTPGNYTIAEQLTIGWMLTAPASPGTHSLALISGADLTGKNFGNFQLGSISGTAFNDLAGNGTFDTSDTPLTGWKVRLLLNAVAKETVVTSISGQYAFANVGPGSYVIHELLQSGWVQTAPVSPETHAATMTSGLSATGKNFGNFQLGGISGMAFDDANGNGVKDSAELGMSGWRIRLSGARTDSALTDSAGHYSFASLTAGAYVVEEVVQGGRAQTMPPPPGTYNIVMTSGAQHTSANFGSTVLSVLYGRIHARWNILSVPVIPSSGDLSKSALFPTAISPAYGFEDQYVVKDTLELGRGYWLKFDTAQTVGMIGLGRLQDTVSVNKGWNLVGSLKENFLSATVASDPEGMLESPFYGYSNGYSAEDTLEPFHAYWVKVSQAGRLFLSAGGNSSSVIAKSANSIRTGASAGESPLEGLSSLEIIDASGNVQTLRFGARDSGAALLGSELPPLPPSGIFDARFTTDRNAESHPSAIEKPLALGIRVQAEAFPLTVRWKIAQGAPFAYRLSRELRGKVEKTWSLAADGSTEIASASVIHLLLTVEPSAAVPKEYALEQNYPNPFNPSTEIGYALPSRSYVTLTIYNLLGEVVETLVDGIEDAGAYQKRWTPNVASGVYFYRIDAQNVADPGSSFTKVRKMMLLH